MADDSTLEGPAGAGASEDGDSEEFTAYDLFISVTATASLAVIALGFAIPETSEIYRLLNLFDLTFCGIFFLDFLRNVARAKDRRRYLRTWGIFDLASAVPPIEAFRVLRIVRIIRVLRALRSIRILARVARKNTAAAILVGFLTITMGLFIGICIAVLHLESSAPGANILDADDVLWWAVVTSSTVGYGDYYPVTETGRLLASILMFVGIGLFATASGSIAGAVFQSFQAGKSASGVQNELAALREATTRIEQKLAALENQEREKN